jgi:hypothetical protein
MFSLGVVYPTERSALLVLPHPSSNSLLPRISERMVFLQVSFPHHECIEFTQVGGFSYSLFVVVALSWTQGWGVLPRQFSTWYAT